MSGIGRRGRVGGAGVLAVVLSVLFGGATCGGATLPGGIALSSGTTVAVVPMGHLSDSANRFYETLTAGPSGPWTLTTPTGVATNGGIVLASPDASAAAVLPWYLLRFTAVRPLAAGRAAGTGQVLPPLASSPSALSIDRNGEVAFVTTRGVVMQGRSLAGPFTVDTSVAGLRSSAAGRRCGIVSVTSVVAGSGGVAAVGATCAHPGSDGIFTRTAAGWRVGSTALATPVGVVRLDAGSSGSMSALVSLGGSHPALAAGVWSAGRLRLAGQLRVRISALRSTELVAEQNQSPAAYVVASSAGRGVRASRLPVVGGATALGPSLPGGVQAVVARTTASTSVNGGSTSAFVVDGSVLRELTLTPSGSRWVASSTLHVPVPYGTSK